jgi:hypothetical protein
VVATYAATGAAPNYPAASTSTTLTTDAGTAVGDLLLAQVIITDNAAVTAFPAPTGWTAASDLLILTSPVTGAGRLFYRYAGAAGAQSHTFTFTGTASLNTGAIARFTGISGTNDPFGGSLVGYIGNVSTIPSQAYTAPGTGRGLWYHATRGDAPTVTAPAGYTTRGTPTAVGGLWVADRAETAGAKTTGTGTTNIGWGVTHLYVGTILDDNALGTPLPVTETWPGANGASWPAQWTTTGAGGTSTVNGANQGLQVTPATAYTLAPSQYLSGMAPVVDSETTVTIYPASTEEHYAVLNLRSDGERGTSDANVTRNGYVLSCSANGQLYIQRVVNSVITQFATPTYTFSTTVGTNIKVLLRGAAIRIRMWQVGSTEPSTWNIYDAVDPSPYLTAGKVFLTAVSGTAATSRTITWGGLTVTDGIDPGAGYLLLESGDRYELEGSTDDYLLDTALPALSSFTDDFSTADAAKFVYSEVTGVTAAGQLSIPVASTYKALRSTNAYNLVGSGASVRVVQRPNVGSGGTEAIFSIVQARSGTDPDNSVDFNINGTNLLMRAFTASSSSSNTSITYDATAHAWLRIRELAGSILWDTSPDGVTWTNRRTRVNDIAVWAMRVRFLVGYFGTETTPGTAVFDDLNLAAPTAARFRTMRKWR